MDIVSYRDSILNMVSVRTFLLASKYPLIMSPTDQFIIYLLKRFALAGPTIGFQRDARAASITSFLTVQCMYTYTIVLKPPGYTVHMD